MDTRTPATDSPALPGDQAHAAFLGLRERLSAVIVGQAALVERLLVALLADGHLLVEGAPGLAKTTAIRTLAAHLEADFARVQFTPDLLPADLTGTEVWRPQEGRFEFQPGPVFHPLLLADEINRAPAKVQSALLEAMGERQVTVGRQTYALPALFLVMATQNPIEQEGTFPLPEAQLDRFMLSVSMGYPSVAEEEAILRRFTAGDPLAQLQPAIGKDDIAKLQRQASSVYASDEIVRYLLAIVAATRQHADIAFGVSPRGSLQLMKAAQARAVLRGRDYVVPDDVKALVGPVFAHRIILKDTFRGEASRTRQLLERLVADIEVPTESAIGAK